MADTTDTLSITLGTKTYALRKLTLRQARTIGIGVLKDSPNASPESVFVSSVDQAIDIVATALARETPPVTSDVLLDMELGIREIRTAADEILLFSGFLKAAEPGDAPSGEEAPGAA